MQLVDGGRIFNYWKFEAQREFERQGSIIEEAPYRFGNGQWSASTV